MARAERTAVWRHISELLHAVYSNLQLVTISLLLLPSGSISTSCSSELVSHASLDRKRSFLHKTNTGSTPETDGLITSFCHFAFTKKCSILYLIERISIVK